MTLNSKFLALATAKEKPSGFTKDETLVKLINIYQYFSLLLIEKYQQKKLKLNISK